MRRGDGDKWLEQLRSPSNTIPSMDSIDQIRKKKHEAWLLSQNSQVQARPASSSSSAMASSLIMNGGNQVLDLTGDDDSDEAHVEQALLRSLQFPSSLNDECEIIDAVKPSSLKIATDDSSLKPAAFKNDFLDPVFHPIFSICSYNVWFGRGDGDPHPVERMKNLASLILSATPRPLFVGFQEVTHGLRSILSPLLESAGYRLYHQENVPYGCALAVMERPCHPQMGLRVQVLEHGFERYKKTSMERGLLWVLAKVYDTDQNVSKHVIFTTTHLESYLSSTYSGSSQRINQIQQASEFCTDRMTRWNQNHGYGESVRMSIISGDLNWDDERKKSEGADPNLLMTVNGRGPQWIDAWKETHPGKGEDGFTYDAKMNPMLGGNLRRRFDRCLAHTLPANQEDKPEVHAVKIIGTKAIEGVTWSKPVQKWQNGEGLVPTGQFKSVPVLPSDHYGLIVVFGGPRAVSLDDHEKQNKRKR